MKRRKLSALFVLLTLVFWMGSGVEKLSAAAPKYEIRVNRKQNCVTVYTKDKAGKYTVPYKAMVCSTGGKLTPLGTYKIPVKYRWRALVENTWGQYSTRISGPYLFHSVPYSRMDPSAMLKGEFNKLGRDASHGCIRLTVEDAKWIYDNVSIGTTVIIYDDEDPGPLGKPKMAKIGEEDTWDPTDIWSEGNPFLTAAPEIRVEGALEFSLSDTDSYDFMEGVTAVSSTGEDITKRVKIDGKKAVLKAITAMENDGAEAEKLYRITYQVEDLLGRSAQRARYVRLKK